MAPEYLKDKVITLKSDIYSLGVLIMETLTGKKECATVDIVRKKIIWTSPVTQLF